MIAYQDRLEVTEPKLQVFARLDQFMEQQKFVLIDENERSRTYQRGSRMKNLVSIGNANIKRTVTLDYKQIDQHMEIKLFYEVDTFAMMDFELGGDQGKDFYSYECDAIKEVVLYGKTKENLGERIKESNSAVWKSVRNQFLIGFAAIFCATALRYLLM